MYSKYFFLCYLFFARLQFVLGNIKPQPCSGNSAQDRSSWCDYDIDTDYYSITPYTGETREYWFELEEGTLAPDGVRRYVQTINGSFPGPTIYANWGDEVIVHLTNRLTHSNNGTSIHFHGIRQLDTVQNDGVVSITQCPTAPGDTITYQWRAAQYGTTWYHSHFSLQAWEGLLGGIVIEGPASANYDEDKGILIISDWSHETPDELFDYSQTVGPPFQTNGLINGTNIYVEGSNQVGERFTTQFQSGLSYRLRLVNTAIDTQFSFSIDNHTMTVIAADLVPVKPFTTAVLSMGIAQRYDVIVTANQGHVADKFWIRAVPQQGCSNNNSTNNIRGIIYYDNNGQGTPSTTGYNTSIGCIDESSNLSPVVEKSVPEDYLYYENETVTLVNSSGLLLWEVNDVSMLVDWQDPSLLQIYKQEDDWSKTAGVIQLNEANAWAYVLVQSSLPVTHPIHLHGHDFYVLEQGTGAYDTSKVPSNDLSNPPRRDTALLLAGGYLLLAFQTDNPGAWLMHCHIGFHTVGGLAIQFIEQYSKISNLLDSSTMSATCKNWDQWQNSQHLVDDDSGI